MLRIGELHDLTLFTLCFHAEMKQNRQTPLGVRLLMRLQPNGLVFYFLPALSGFATVNIPLKLFTSLCISKASSMESMSSHLDQVPPTNRSALVTLKLCYKMKIVNIEKI